MAVDRNEMDAFEQRLKESLEQYEVPYNSADWAQMERALASGVRAWGHGRALIVGLLMAGGLLIGGTAYFIGRDTGSHLADGGTPVVRADHGTLGEAVTATLPAMPEEAEEAVLAGGNTDQHLTGDEGPVSTEQAMGQQDALATTTTSAASLQPAAAGHGADGSMNSTIPATNRPSRSGPSNEAGMFRASMSEACPGSPVEFVVEHMPEDGIYLWNFGDGSFSNKPNPEHVYTKPGRYQVMLSMSSTGAGVIHNKPTSSVIVIHEPPYAAFNIIRMDYEGKIPSVHFESRAHGVKSYLWDFGDGTVSTEANPNHVYRKKGVYQVVQTVTNEIGCTDRKVQELRVERDFDLDAPKSFTPNNDGVEDSFMPGALLELTSKFQLAIYDQAGNLVYNTGDATRAWYGKARNQGPVLAEGEYVWMVDVETDRGPETFTGSVLLKR